MEAIFPSHLFIRSQVKDIVGKDLECDHLLLSGCSMLFRSRN
jgi:hypothetical protein